MTVLPTIISDSSPLFSWLVDIQCQFLPGFSPFLTHTRSHSTHRISGWCFPIAGVLLSPLVPRTPCLLTQQPVDRPSLPRSQCLGSQFLNVQIPCHNILPVVVVHLSLGESHHPSHNSSGGALSWPLPNPQILNLLNCQHFPLLPKQLPVIPSLGEVFSKLPSTWKGVVNANMEELPLYSNVKSCFLRGR